MSEKEHRDEDEEISIDFSKVTNFFKGKKKAEDIDKKADKVEAKIEKQIAKEEEKIEDLKEAEEQVEEIKEQAAEQLKKEDKKADKIKEKAVKKIEKVEKKLTEEKEDEDEVSIDFSKITNLFKGNNKSRSQKDKKEESDEEDLSIDFGKVKDMFSAKSLKEHNKTIIFMLILIPLLLSIFLRVQPAYLPITDSWAENNVVNFYKNQIKAEIDQKYPNLPDANKAAMIDEKFAEFEKANKAQIEEQVKQSSAYFKSHFQDDKGQTYLLAIDPYFWLLHSENILERGHVGDELRDGKPYDTHMLAPIGRVIPGDVFNSYFEAYLFKIMHIFFGDLYLMKLAFYVPVLLSALCVIPAFFIARKIGGNVAGFFSSMLIAVHPSFLTRTVGGFADTDAYNILFPLIITWFVIESIDAKDNRWKVLLGTIAGFLVGMYSFSWGGWWHIFLFMIASLGLYMIYHAADKITKVKKSISELWDVQQIKTGLIVLGVFLISSGIFTSLFTDSGNFARSFMSPLGFSQIKDVATQKIWPNVLTTVAEQNETSFDQTILSLGGNLLLAIAIIGVILTMFRKDKNGNREVRYAIILTIWFVATLYATTKGIRWTLLVVPAFSIAFGAAAGIISQYASKWASKGLDLNETVSKIAIVLLFGLLLIAPIKMGYATALNEIPSFNDAWYDSLTKIKQNSEPNAIITSWWDFGHWFKAMADRPVTFDGTSQDTPQAHWVGKSLQTDDEDLAMGILRMLDCGANNAFDIMFNATKNNTDRSIEILYEILVLDKEAAIEKLESYGISKKDIDSIIRNTYCNPPEAFYITSEDMVGKAGVWGHFGLWDFKKATIFYRAKRGIKSISEIAEEINESEDKTEQLYYEAKALSGSREVNDWIASWPGYVSGVTGCKKTDNKLDCVSAVRGGGQIRVLVDTDTWEAEIPTPQGTMYPDILVYANKTGVYQKKYIKNNIGISVAIIPQGLGYSSLWMSSELAMSMFTRLFYFKGHGLKHFDLFHDQTDITGLNIKTWKVDWEGADANIMQDIIQQEDSKIEVRASHILVSTKEEAEEIKGFLDEGEDFADLAKNRSLDTGSAQTGGDLGWFKRGVMIPEFENSAFSMKIGEVSDIIQTQFGYHIIKLTGRKNIDEEKEGATALPKEETGNYPANTSDESENLGDSSVQGDQGLDDEEDGAVVIVS